MPFWRRRKALHEELAEGTDLLEWDPTYEPATQPPFKGTLDVLHGGRPRRWDTVVTADAPALGAEEIQFTALPDGTLLIDDAVPEGALSPLADAVEQSVSPPYRAHAVRGEGELWRVAANRIEVVEVPEEIDGDTVSFVAQGEQRTLLVDDRPTWTDVPTLEALASERHREFVLHAERLDGALWAVKVNAL
ncbi:MAG TPA: hypothetical protein VGU26_04140 [Gaiellaceae bacterium]|nr:hypothetical protein [Gaiellaceae bacterium]